MKAVRMGLTSAMADAVAHYGNLGTITYGRGPPGPVVNSVLRTPDGVVSVRPKAIL